jgi:hypothetical protein
VFTSSAVANSYSNILYSSVFNKLCIFLNSTFFVFDPSDNTLTFNTGLPVPNNAMWPYEDVTNELIFVNSTNAGPTDNLYWYGADLANITPCPEGKVDMYLGNAGPYEFNTLTSSWEALCTSSVGVVGVTITANATLSASVVTAALVYTTDYGLTWNVLADNGGNIYANPAVWLAGRTYTKPAGAVQVKVSFSTVTGCGLEGITMNV